MRHCGRDAIRQQEWNRSKENWCVQGEPDPNHIRDVDDDLILFNDMTRKNNKGLLHPPNDNDIGDVPLRKFFNVSDLLSNYRIDVFQYDSRTNMNPSIYALCSWRGVWSYVTIGVFQYDLKTNTIPD